MPRMRTAIILVLSLFSSPALAVTGGGGSAPSSVVMISGSPSSVCTGTAIARDLILTAAHCMQLSGYRVVPQGGGSISVQEIATHPRFDMANYERARATADVALVKLASPLPANVAIAPLSGGIPTVGARMSIAGFGVTASRSDSGLGIARSASLVVTGQPGSLQIRLYDPATRNERAGLGACTGDSGGPAFSGNAVAGIVSWTTGPGNSDGCGGLTGITPLSAYRSWIVEQARRMGSPLGSQLPQ
jgi:secreted trypsin-like serine protease